MAARCHMLLTKLLILLTLSQEHASQSIKTIYIYTRALSASISAMLQSNMPFRITSYGTHIIMHGLAENPNAPQLFSIPSIFWWVLCTHSSTLACHT